MGLCKPANVAAFGLANGPGHLARTFTLGVKRRKSPLKIRANRPFHSHPDTLSSGLSDHCTPATMGSPERMSPIVTSELRIPVANSPAAYREVHTEVLRA